MIKLSRVKVHKTKVMKSSLGGGGDILLKNQLDTLERAGEYALKMRVILKAGPFPNTIGKPKASLVPFQVQVVFVGF